MEKGLQLCQKTYISLAAFVERLTCMSLQAPLVCDMLNERGMTTRRADKNQRNQKRKHVFRSMTAMGIPSIETITEALHSFIQDNLGQRDVLVLEEDISFF